MKKNIFVKYSVILALVLMTALCGCARDNGAKSGLICNFENPKIWDISPEEGFDISVSDQYVTEGKKSLKVIYPTGRYPSINTRKLKHLWGDYDSFKLDIYNPQQVNINFVMRLDGMNKRRVNLPYTLKPGWNNISISRQKIAKSIDPKAITYVVLFIDNAKERYTLYFDNMRVEAGERRTANGEQRPKAIDIKEVQETFEPVVQKNVLPQKGAFKVPVARLTTEKKESLLVSSGVPFGPGEIFSDKNIAFFDKSGNEISIATKILARWPQDGSVRSILVQFPYGIEKRYKYLTMQWGEPRTLEDRALIDVTWDMPEAMIVLPSQWLCGSRVTGWQVPMVFDRMTGKPLRAYDKRAIDYYEKIRQQGLTEKARQDDFYDTAHVFYQLYTRSGSEEFFRFARMIAVDYRNNKIIHEGAERGKHINHSQTRYIYVQAMVDDYLLTGDAKSLEVAGYMAEYLKNAYPAEKAFYPKGAEGFWTEREPAFPLIGITSYYELTGDAEYLKAAQGIVSNLYKTQCQWPDRGGFIHNLYSHDPEEGAEPGERGGSPFMTGLLLEGIVKYHQLTGSTVAKDSIVRALDWLTNECVAPDGETFVYTTAESKQGEGHPDLNMLIVHAFGYGYRISDAGRDKYLELGKKIFERGVKSARLTDIKHFNQNYRSSGHFLAYIQE